MALTRSALIHISITTLGIALIATACKTGDNDGPDGDERPTATVAGTAAIGGACKTLADCASGATECNDDPGGQCTKACTTPADCSAGSVCESERPGNCYKECTSKADCPRDGYDCVGGPNPEGKKWCDVVKADKVDARCLPDGGFVDNACDTCENAGCCGTRFACYDDQSCDAANKAFDDCLAAAESDAGPDATKVAKCWSDLSASGPVAKARVDCQRSTCKAECKVP